LCDHFLAKIGEELHRHVRGISDAAVRTLTTYDWPGNVRELEHALTRAVVLARGPYIDVEHLSLGSADIRAGGNDGPRDDSLEAVEASQVQRILRETGWVKRRAAETLKISRTRLDRLIEKYGLEVSD
jgi:DNA-binding NtrC family response regulator